MFSQYSFKSPAKINLFLHITSVRDDGYHNLQTAFQFIDLHDTLTFTNINQHGPITIDSPIPGIEDEQNLIYKAATLLKKHTACSLGARITVDKKIPMGGGLGGGSSNAATTLVALNSLWNTQLPNHELKAIALSLGADVPIFVHGTSAWAEGIGEQFTNISLAEPWYLLAIPNCHVETAKLFQDKHLTKNTKPITMRAFLNGDSHNDFEPIAKKNFPLINKTLDLLSEWGDAKLTGTGACCFCSVQNQATGQKALKDLAATIARHKLKPEDLKVILTKGQNGSPLYESAQLDDKNPKL